jgi:predicted PurR-regulated permease PerM
LTREQQIKSWLIGIVVFLALLFLLRSVLLPFVAAMAVAYFLDPLADKLESWGCSRSIATTLITAAFFLVVILILMLLFPLLQSQVLRFVSRVPKYMELFQTFIAPMVEQVQSSLSSGDVKTLQKAAGTYATDVFKWLTSVVKGLVGGGVAVFEVLSLIIITPVVSFYLLRDWDVIVNKVDGWLPQDAAPTIREQLSEIDKTIAGFVRGQSSVCLTLATFYAIGLTLAGLEFGLLVGIGAGLISFIPYIGAAIGLAVGVGIAFAQFDTLWPIILVAGIFVVGQTAESYFLTPKLVGEKVGLHPVWLIFALMAGGALFGFTGVLLAIPVAAVIGVLVRFSLTRYLESGLYKSE